MGIKARNLTAAERHHVSEATVAMAKAVEHLRAANLNEFEFTLTPTTGGKRRVRMTIARSEDPSERPRLKRSLRARPIDRGIVERAVGAAL